jgi:hypothetical protein
VEKVLLAIRKTWRGHEGRVLEGEGREALEEFYRQRTNKGPINAVSGNVPLTLAFYTRWTSWNVYLQSVTRRGNLFTIRYQPVPNQTRMSQTTLALIPIGSLPSGKYRVAVEQLPMDQTYADRGFSPPPAALINDISNSFEFFVSQKKDK